MKFWIRISCLLGLLLLVFGSSWSQETNRTEQLNLACDNWLLLPAQSSKVVIGDVDVSGNQLTIEASFNRTQPLNSGLYYGSLVSKHTGAPDVNYSLLPNGCEITTTGTGYTAIFQTCPVQLNKTYHVAMTYDGTTLKFYRNGLLLSQTPCTGNIVNNNLLTSIGQIAGGGDPSVNQFLGYVNEVRIWNVARTQAQLQSFINTTLPPAQTGLLAYYVFNDATNKQGNAAFNGTLMNGAVVNQTNTSCTFTATDCFEPCPVSGDFSYKRNVCSPLSVTYANTTTGYNTIRWEFGDGNLMDNVGSAVHDYAVPGIYNVKMITRTNSCADTVVKQIKIEVETDPALVITNDAAICPGAPLQLQASAQMDFCWSPTNFLSATNIPQPIATPTQDITYFYTARFISTNRVTNGDFALGNSGFSSQYSSASNNTVAGQYTIAAIPESWNATFSPCRDHTGTGSPNMMIVNGSSVANSNIWSQTITVTPNTNYVFSTWIQSLAATNPAQLSFTINGNEIGDLIAPGTTTCVWKQSFVSWNSGNRTSITIGIRNKNTGANGNDFALDDISFGEEIFKRDSVKITMKQITVVASGITQVCEGKTTNLNAVGATSYIWSPASGLNDPSIPNPIATINAPIRYIVTGTDAQGCAGKDTLDIGLFPRAVIGTSNDTAICRSTTAQLLAFGGLSYSWTPAATLNNPAIANPIASPLTDTKYYVMVTDGNTCTYLDSVQLSIRPDAVFTLGPPATICLKESTQLNAAGGTIYQWQPATGLNDPGIPNPIASPIITTDYTVTIQETVCNQTSTLSTRVTVSPLPVVSATSANDIDCSNNSSQLLATGASSYAWSPAGSLSNPNISNPVATPVVTTEYIVTGSNSQGCKNNDTISIKVSNIGAGGYLMPSAFTPNNDGLNDCYGVKYWGAIQKLEFSIYNRWGERIFYTTDPSQCWDGTYKGIKQDPAVFIYMIRASTFCDDNVFRKGTFTLIR